MLKGGIVGNGMWRRVVVGREVGESGENREGKGGRGLRERGDYSGSSG